MNVMLKSFQLVKRQRLINMNQNIGEIGTHDVLLTRKDLGLRQPGDLGVLRGVILGFSEEARTRGFAPLTLVRFAFIVCN
jgi:hypothetical protein